MWVSSNQSSDHPHFLIVLSHVHTGQGSTADLHKAELVTLGICACPLKAETISLPLSAVWVSVVFFCFFVFGCYSFFGRPSLCFQNARLLCYTK